MKQFVLKERTTGVENVCSEKSISIVSKVCKKINDVGNASRSKN